VRVASGREGKEGKSLTCGGGGGGGGKEEGIS